MLDSFDMTKQVFEQLKDFKLTNYTFKIDRHLSAENKSLSNQNWCFKNDTKSADSKICTLIVHSKETQSWCLKQALCHEETSFICQWIPLSKRRHNKKLGRFLKSTFYFLFLGSLLALVVLLVLFASVLRTSDQYLFSYLEAMQHYLALNEKSTFYFKKLI